MRTKHINALRKYGSVRKAAASMGLARSTFFDNLNREKGELSRVQSLEDTFHDPVRARKVRTYIFSCAVKGAEVHTDFLANLEAYAAHTGAELVIGPLAKNSGRGPRHVAPIEAPDFPLDIADYISDSPLLIGDKIRFSPELNLTPSMARPLSGLQTYTKQYWGIFPHTKISLETVPTHKHKPAKFITTTGCVTHPHYSETKTGRKAHFDHVYGAIIVEVSKTGVWFRHLVPTDEYNGSFYDLDNYVQGGRVQSYPGAAAIVYGDIHIEQMDSAVGRATWGWLDDEFDDSLVNKLRPITQVFHDLMDMTAANYHELNDPIVRYEKWARHQKNVENDFWLCFQFLRHVAPLAMDNVIVDSNHEYFIDKWLKQFDPLIREDFGNAETFYKLKLARLDAIRRNRDISFMGLLMETQASGKRDQELLEKFRFLKPDESMELFNIELGWHGHRGPNGRRGSKHAFKFVTEKSTIAHLHSPSIESGCHVVGTSSKLDLGYNEGPSSWAPTHGIIYPNGARTLITMSDGKFWATQNE